MAVTIRRNDYAEPQPGTRLTYAEWRRLRLARRDRDDLIRRLLRQGVAAQHIADAIR